VANPVRPLSGGRGKSRRESIYTERETLTSHEFIGLSPDKLLVLYIPARSPYVLALHLAH
jgi:hypothetical protein